MFIWQQTSLLLLHTIRRAFFVFNLLTLSIHFFIHVINLFLTQLFLFFFSVCLVLQSASSLAHLCFKHCFFSVSEAFFSWSCCSFASQAFCLNALFLTSFNYSYLLLSLCLTLSLSEAWPSLSQDSSQFRTAGLLQQITLLNTYLLMTPHQRSHFSAWVMHDLRLYSG